jgi:hypothetical protein
MVAKVEGSFPYRKKPRLRHLDLEDARKFLGVWPRCAFNDSDWSRLVAALFDCSCIVFILTDYDPENQLIS